MRPVLLDVLGADARFGERSRAALRSAYDSGALLAGPKFQSAANVSSWARAMTPTPVEIAAGAFHLPGYLSLGEQRALVARCRELGARPAGLYTPIVRGGATMRIQMLCLGRHWNPLTYQYEATRSDFDGRPAPELPEDLAQLARGIAADLGVEFQPDICIMNLYPATGRLGLHQDKDERPETLAAGVPIVSVSLGDTAIFLVGGTRRKDPVRTIHLQSGDVCVLGGPSRLRYHGVSRVLPGTAPAALALEGRFNLTFRQYALAPSPQAQ